MILFNCEETELIAAYMPAESRLALIKRIVKETAGMEKDIRSIAESAVDKLARMSDLEYMHMAFLPAI